MPVVPPVSKTYSGLPSSPFGSHRLTGPPRSQSSSNGGNCLRPSKSSIASGSKSYVPFFSSQNGLPVSSEKCHFTSARTWASSIALHASTFSSAAGPAGSAAAGSK